MHHDPQLDLEKKFRSYAPGYWADADVSESDWNSAKWQLKNRITSLTQLETHLNLSEEERNGVILSGTKLAMAITPHFFNLIDGFLTGGFYVFILIFHFCSDGSGCSSSDEIFAPTCG